MRIQKVVVFCMLSMLMGCSTVKNNTDNNDKKNNFATAQINMELGMAYLEQKEVSRAKQKLLSALDEAPELPESWYSMAYFLESTGNNEAANQYYLKAIRLAPHRGDTHNNYGTYLCRTHHYQEAIKHFMLAVQDTHYLEPAAAYENAGLCSLKIPDVHQAKIYFARAIREDPRRTLSFIELAKLNHQDINTGSSTPLYAMQKNEIERG